ncbi:Inner membrane transport protein YajR, partial [Durusdinium trenchii]
RFWYTARPAKTDRITMSNQQTSPLVRAEMRATGALASIFALRMFGLFMLLPVLALLGTELPDASPVLIGTAVGAYGLMQALLQIPFGLSGLFWITSGLGLVALLVALFLVPTVRASQHRAPLTRHERMRRVLANPVLMRLNVGILVLHAVMTCSFVVVPLWLSERLGFDLAQHSLLYLAVLVAGFLAMVPLIIRSERRGFLGVKRLAIVLLLVAELLLAFFAQHLWQFVLALFVFFTAFNLLEALLPSLVGRAAPAGTKGTSMGVYSTSQFLGVFIGGQLGGLALQFGDGSWAFI